jgi:chemotaxis protein methyltransferase CheR
MVLADFVGTARDPDFAILATDIDTNVLEEARRGIYPLTALAPCRCAARRYVAMPAIRAAAKRDRARTAPKIGFAR